MTDLICRTTMRACQTPGMCSPFGGCGVAPPAPTLTHCRTDGRCQYAIDSGAEGMGNGHCPPGQCVMAAPSAEPVEPQPANFPGAHHCTVENVRALIRNFRLVASGESKEAWLDGDWRTRSGVLATVLEWLISPAPTSTPREIAQFRSVGSADWYDGHADSLDGGGPYEERTLYAHPAPTEPTAESVEWLLARCEEYQRRAHEAEIEVMRLRAQIEQIGGGR